MTRIVILYAAELAVGLTAAALLASAAEEGSGHPIRIEPQQQRAEEIAA